jgi:protein-S-isoprenylcysteine O-methyltransferase Ste14
MFLIPAFELGLWNSWIFILPLILASITRSRILSKRKAEEESGITKGKTVSLLYFSIVILSYVYSVFLPLKLNTIWFLVGLLLYLPAISFLFIGLLNFASTPIGELVTKGAYSYSRNPSYVSEVLLMIGIGIACLSWIFLLVAFIEFILLRHYVVAVEEPLLLEKYREDYREYMNRTPRWLGIPKSDKSG